MDAKQFLDLFERGKTGDKVVFPFIADREPAVDQRHEFL